MRVDDAYHFMLGRCQVVSYQTRHIVSKSGATLDTDAPVDMVAGHLVDQIRKLNETGLLKIVNMAEA
jgi:hypothetical protein